MTYNMEGHFMLSQNLPINKLILLYIAGEVPGIRRTQLGDAALATLSMDYFEMASALDELIKTRLIHVAARRDEKTLNAHEREVERCDLTAEGRLVLNALNDQIPASTRRFLTNYLEKNALKRRTEDQITATVEETARGMYRLICRNTSDGDETFLLKMTFPSEKLAKKAAATWRYHYDDILTVLLEVFSEDRDKEQ
jgi:hypothetical protein